MSITTPAPVRILVVEDALFTRTLLTSTLQAAGYLVDAADSLAGALALIGKHPPDVAVVDIFLADCASGLDVAQALRTQRNTALTFIVAISGHHAPDCLRLCHDAKCDRFLVKPFAPSLLLEMIDHFLGSPHLVSDAASESR